jgi:hypothetical protein
VKKSVLGLQGWGCWTAKQMFSMQAELTTAQQLLLTSTANKSTRVRAGEVFFLCVFSAVFAARALAEMSKNLASGGLQRDSFENSRLIAARIVGIPARANFCTSPNGSRFRTDSGAGAFPASLPRPAHSGRGLAALLLSTPCSLLTTPRRATRGVAGLAM